MEPTVDTNENPSTGWLEKSVYPFIASITKEKVIFAVIILLAVFTRFYMLGDRVMAHDEINHVRPSWQLYMGQGYSHDPVTHGPMQFHLLALSYFLFGDNDFTSRVPIALFSVGCVLICWKYRKYLGKTGAILAALMMCISPFMMFYGRYTRNDDFVALWGLITLYGIMRYYETGQKKYILILAGVMAGQFITKETSFIYTAQSLLLTGFIFIREVSQKKWAAPEKFKPFILGLIVAILLIGMGFGLILAGSKGTAAAADTLSTTATTLAAEGVISTPKPFVFSALPLILIGIALIDLAVSLWYLYTGLGGKTLRSIRSFDLLIVFGTLVLPQLTAFPIKMLGWDPLDYSSVSMLRTGIMLAVMIVVSVGIGVWWDWKTWIKAAGIFYTIFIVFYTTFFTNGQGFFTGIIGSLGYWLAQQGVHRGEQPWYYYSLIQIPVYEFLSGTGALLGTYYVVKNWILRKDNPYTFMQQGKEEPETEFKLSIAPVLVFWSISSLIAYSIAGEKMPWLTVHIAWPMIMLAGWSFGHWIETTPWDAIKSKHGWIILALLAGFITAFVIVIKELNTLPLPFQGNELAQLQATSSFIFAVLALAGTGVGFFVLINRWSGFDGTRLIGIGLMVLMTILTARAAFRANFINYDTANEYLVYAHAARGPKDMLEQIEEISKRIAGGNTLTIAYDNNGLYPYWWYLRDYPNLKYFGETPGVDIRDAEIVIAGDQNYSKVEPILGKNYYSFTYTRLWWPNQDYWNLTWDRIKAVITDPQIREGVFDIWLNRDYTAYAKATNNTTMTLETWEPSERIRLYIRKDVVAKIWNYGAAPQTETDPYAKGKTTIAPDIQFGTAGSDAGMYNAPRGLAVAADGSLYIADSKNNRIQHIAADGTVIKTWGTFADVEKGDAPGGTFNEPWGVAVGPDGSVYITDTWNFRVQKFDANGNFLKMWGYFGQAEKPDAFWGPRGIYVDAQNKVFITDTGNKRVTVFDAEGNPITQFGSAGAEAGLFNEPVGITGDADGNIYVADTWNLRVQVFKPDDAGNYQSVTTWDVNGWSGESLDNKPFITVDQNGHLFAADPEGYRILEFTTSGEFVRTWGDYSQNSDGFGLVGGVAADAQGNLWVCDAGNNRILHFTMEQ
jgi:predicted membrane-bound mannosyltransferase/sugar lactone lactonase YvrE